MSDPEGFLGRWSRRKRESTQEAAAAPPAPPGEAARDMPAEARTAEAPANAEPAFDPDLLPPLESIDATTDITPFLAKGVPADLTRAALRRVWTADPAIRDFVGLAEYAWDFNDPGAIAGFGTIASAEEAQRLLAEAIGAPSAPAERVEAVSREAEPVPDAPAPANQEIAAAPQVERSETELEPAADLHEDAADRADAAVQNEASAPQSAANPPRRRGGGALPQ